MRVQCGGHWTMACSPSSTCVHVNPNNKERSIFSSSSNPIDTSPNRRYFSLSLHSITRFSPSFLFSITTFFLVSSIVAPFISPLFLIFIGASLMGCLGLNKERMVVMGGIFFVKIDVGEWMVMMAKIWVVQDGLKVVKWRQGRKVERMVVGFGVTVVKWSRFSGDEGGIKGR